MKWIRWFGEWRRVDRELKAEIEEHLHEKIDELVESGVAVDEARVRAQREVGNVTRIVEASREAWGFTWLDEVMQDLRYGVRTSRRSPILASVAVLSLALGIGSTTAIFSLIDSVILRTLPVARPDALVIVRALTRQGTPDAFSHTDYEWLNEHNRVFTGLAASSRWGFTRRLDSRTETLNGELVSGNYFSVLGVDPILGRAIRASDDTGPGGHPVVMISYPYWQRAFGGNPNVLGRRIRFRETALEIVGVAPRGFTGEYVGYSTDLWVPLSMQPALNRGNSFLRTRNVSWLQTTGRLRPGVTIDQAGARMSILLDSLRDALRVDPQSDYLGAIGIEPGGGGLSNLRDRYARPLWILMALVALVLAIACANVANLLLARSATRRREFAVRLALGADRSRLLRQLFVEAWPLAGIACVLGVAIAHGLIRVLLAISQVDALDVHVNLKVLGFAVAVSCAAALAFGLAPAIQSRRVIPWPALKRDARALAGAGRSHPLRLLVAVQAALSLLLLIGSGLLLRTFVNLQLLDPGFDEQHVLQVHLDVPDDGSGGVALGRAMVERLSQVAGVGTVSFSAFGFGQGSNRICCIDVEGYTPRLNEERSVRVQSVSPGYFATLGIAFLAGRDFNAADEKTSSPVAIINETMARYYFRDSPAIGKRFAWWHTDPKNIEIVGVVKDSKYDNLRQDPMRMAYQPSLQQEAGPGFLQVRLSSNRARPLAAVIQDCRAVIGAVDSRVDIRAVEPLSVAVDQTLHPERLVAQLSTGFGAVGLLLTAIGLYGILAYSVARRTAEFGLRTALGAERVAILRMVVGDGLRTITAGLVLGLCAAVPLTGLLAHFLYGVQPRDITTFSGAVVTLTLVALVAAYLPARRATNVDPSVALRVE